MKGNASPCLDDSPEGRLTLERFTSFLLSQGVDDELSASVTSDLEQLQLPYMIMSEVLQSMTLGRHGHLLLLVMLMLSAASCFVFDSSELLGHRINHPQHGLCLLVCIKLGCSRSAEVALKL